MKLFGSSWFGQAIKVAGVAAALMFSVSPGNAQSGYWGDYDEKALAGFSQNSTAPEFMLAFSDSSKGCVNQSEFTSTHLHVSTVVFK